MVLFTILLIALLTLATIVLVATGIVGTATVIVFGDVIVCVGLIALIIKLFKKKK